jgi:hypothetical protein
MKEAQVKNGAKWFGAFVVGGVAGWVIYWLLRKRIGDEERPPIIVKGGSIIFEHEKGWAEAAGDDWKPDHPEGKPIDGFIVQIKRGGQVTQEFRGALLHFLHLHRFIVGIAHDEPKVNPRRFLSARSREAVWFEGGPRNVGEMIVFPGNIRYTLEDDEEAWIDFTYRD